MSRPISLPLFALGYLPAAMIAAAASLIALLTSSVTARGSPTPGGDTFLAASVLTTTLLTIGAPMIVMGTRALGCRLRGGAPIWAMLLATWGIAAWDILRIAGLLPLPRLPLETLPFCAVAFVALTAVVFFTGLWRLTRMCQPEHVSQRFPR